MNCLIYSPNFRKVVDLADKLWNDLVKKNRIDIGQKQKKTPTERQRNMVFEENIRHPDVREIGGEWLCCQALGQLKMADFLTNIGFSEEETRLALTQIVSHAVYPASELETARWIKENSGICQITGYCGRENQGSGKCGRRQVYRELHHAELLSQSRPSKSKGGTLYRRTDKSR